MKATGIVRRIDDLGRVVIPKEIRRTLRIREGDPLEIYTDREGQIVLKKYSMMGDLGEFAKQYADALSQTTGHIDQANRLFFGSSSWPCKSCYSYTDIRICCKYTAHSHFSGSFFAHSAILLDRILAYI